MNRSRLLSFTLLGAGLLAPSSWAQTWVPRAELLPAGGYGTPNHFGVSLSVHGNWTLVGSPSLDETYGRAYLFERQGSSWVQQAQWTAHATHDGFGTAVALSADTILVGAPEHEDESGSVHLLSLRDGEWVHEHVMGMVVPVLDAKLGETLAVSGDTALVGAPGMGGVHVLERSAGVWTYGGELLPSVAPQEDFGAALAFDGTYIFVGSPREDAVHVFERTGLPSGTGAYSTAWIETARLTPGVDSEIEHFGQAVALRGSTALIGAPEEAGEGAVFVYEHGPLGWSLAEVLTPSSSPPGSEFGTAVALGSNIALVGAPADDANPGATYVYERRGGQWAERTQLFPDVGPGNVSFGYDVAVTGQTLMVNVGLDDTGVLGTYVGKINTWEPSKMIKSADVSVTSAVGRRL